MNAPASTPLRKYRHPVLLGLNEKALAAVYNAGTIRVLKEQEWLFRAGEAAMADFLILEGVANLSRNQGARDTLPLFAGDCLPASLLQLDGSYTWDCQINQPMTVLQLDAGAMLKLDEPVQLMLHRNLLPVISLLFHQLARASSQRQLAASADTEGVLTHLQERQTVYTGTTPLQTMLANIPKLPPYTTKLTALMNDPKASTRSIVDIARQDPSLTASVLKTVNSSYFGLTHKIKDFQHAVMMLGFTQMQQLLINVGVQSTMPNTPEFRQLQAHSMMMSSLASEISLTLKAGSAPLLSTVGILHDIGKSVVLLLKHQHPKQEFLLGMLDPDMVGVLLLREWQLPDNICEVIQYQSWPQLLPPDKIPAAQRESVAVMHVAHLCFDRLRNLQSELVTPCKAKPWLAALGCRDQNLDDFLLGRLIPAINSRSPALPLVLQDLLRKARQSEVGAQTKATSTPP
ncbi:MAG TPA: HDOD domain-containing protein [Candidatus Acidoferrum sp.]|nr:HDOD domain-containing protein [Candidatus Acidoferrum sp.]